MRNIRKRLELGILSLALWIAASIGAMAGQAGPEAIYQPSANGTNIYVSRGKNIVTLSRYSVVIDTWPAKLGRESTAGDKVQQEDEITSSGEFYVRIVDDRSQYYLISGLSYPNVEDTEKGLADDLINQEQYQGIMDVNKVGEKPLWDTPLGGAIEIHGERGGDTAGYIAVTNGVMDTPWQYCNLGAPVTIGP